CNISVLLPSNQTGVGGTTSPDGDGTTPPSDDGSNPSRPPPTIQCPAPLTVNCASSRAVIGRWLASASQSSSCSGTAVTTTFAPASQSCVLNVTWPVTDDCGRASCSSALTLVDTDAPVMTLIGRADVTIECQPNGYTEQGASVDDCDPSLTMATVGGDRVAS